MSVELPLVPIEYKSNSSLSTSTVVSTSNIVVKKSRSPKPDQTCLNYVKVDR